MDKEESFSSDEDEVTFLLRLKPSPSPPVRRKRHSVETKKGWDVIIERRNELSPIISPTPSSASPTLTNNRFSYDVNRLQTQSEFNENSLNINNSRRHVKEFANNNNSRDPPPFLPTKFQPSAPPEEFLQQWHHQKPYYPAVPLQYFPNHEMLTEFSCSYPNLHYIENNRSSFFRESFNQGRKIYGLVQLSEWLIRKIILFCIKISLRMIYD